MRTIILLLSAILVPSSWASQLCFYDATFTCCPPGPPCEFPEPMAWIGFQTDSTGSLACSDFENVTFAAVTLSASDEDPYLNVGEIPSDGRLYLWNVGYGLADPDWAELELNVIGNIPILSFEPIAMNEIIWNPTTGHLYFDGCLGPRPDIVGAFLVDPGTVAVDEPATSLSWGRVKALYR